MSDTLSMAAVALIAILVGAMVPVFIQLRRTLREIERFVTDLKPRVERALTEATDSVVRLNRVGGEMEALVEKVKPVVDSAARVGETLDQAREVMRRAAAFMGALAPALAAALAAFFARRTAAAAAETTAPETGKGESR